MSTSNEYSTDVQAYHSTYSVFLNKSSTLSAKLKWLDENSPDLIRSIKESRDNSQTFSILSVGTSIGKPDIVVLGHLFQLLPQNARVEFTALEPSTEALAEFKRNAEQISTRLTMTTLAMTFQDYCSSEHAAKNSHDLILFVGSLYYCKAEPPLWHSFHKELKSTGAILCTASFEDSQYLKLNRLFHGPSTQPPNSTFTLHTMADLIKIADKHAWRYKTFEYESEIDVTDCFDETSEEGNMLIEFLIHIKDARQLFDEETAKRFSDALESCSVEKADHTRIMPASTGVFVIYK